MKKGGFIIIEDFMQGELSLRGSELLVYAIIWSFCRSCGSFFAAVSYLASRCCVSERTVQYALQRLCERGYIVCLGKHEMFATNIYECTYVPGSSDAALDEESEATSHREGASEAQGAAERALSDNTDAAAISTAEKGSAFRTTDRASAFSTAEGASGSSYGESDERLSALFTRAYGAPYSSDSMCTPRAEAASVPTSRAAALAKLDPTYAAKEGREFARHAVGYGEVNERCSEVSVPAARPRVYAAPERSESKYYTESALARHSETYFNTYGLEDVIRLTDEQYVKLADWVGEHVLENYILRLERYILDHPSFRSYSHYKTIRAWICADMEA